MKETKLDLRSHKEFERMHVGYFYIFNCYFKYLILATYLFGLQKNTEFETVDNENVDTFSFSPDFKQGLMFIFLSAVRKETISNDMF